MTSCNSCDASSMGLSAHAMQQHAHEHTNENTMKIMYSVMANGAKILNIYNI